MKKISLFLSVLFCVCFLNKTFAVNNNKTNKDINFNLTKNKKKKFLNKKTKRQIEKTTSNKFDENEWEILDAFDSENLIKKISFDAICVVQNGIKKIIEKTRLISPIIGITNYNMYYFGGIIKKTKNGEKKFLIIKIDLNSNTPILKIKYLTEKEIENEILSPIYNIFKDEYNDLNVSFNFEQSDLKDLFLKYNFDSYLLLLIKEFVFKNIFIYNKKPYVNPLSFNDITLILKFKKIKHKKNCFLSNKFKFVSKKNKKIKNAEEEVTLNESQFSQEEIDKINSYKENILNYLHENNLSIQLNSIYHYNDITKLKNDEEKILITLFSRDSNKKEFKVKKMFYTIFPYINMLMAHKCNCCKYPIDDVNLKEKIEFNFSYKDLKKMIIEYKFNNHVIFLLQHIVLKDMVLTNQRNTIEVHIENSNIILIINIKKDKDLKNCFTSDGIFTIAKTDTTQECSTTDYED